MPKITAEHEPGASRLGLKDVVTVTVDDAHSGTLCINISIARDLTDWINLFDKREEYIFAFNEIEAAKNRLAPKSEAINTQTYKVTEDATIIPKLKTAIQAGQSSPKTLSPSSDRLQDIPLIRTGQGGCTRDFYLEQRLREPQDDCDVVRLLRSIRARIASFFGRLAK